VPLPDIERPAPLIVAASLTALEAVVLVINAVAELVSLDAGRVTMGLTTSAFFVVYAVALLACAWGLSQLRSWARSPVVMAQLIQFGVAWSFWGHGTTYVSIALIIVAAVVLAGVLHPASIDALADED
jgi:hypothetical protein